MILRAYLNPATLCVRMWQFHELPASGENPAFSVPLLVFESRPVQTVLGLNDRATTCELLDWRPFLHPSRLSADEFNELDWFAKGFEFVAAFGTGAFSRAPSVSNYLAGLVAVANQFPNEIGPQRFGNTNPMQRLVAMMERAKGHAIPPSIDPIKLPRNLRVSRTSVPSRYDF